MISFSVRPLMGASLYSPHPCILTTFVSETSDLILFKQQDVKAQATLVSLISELGIRLELSTKAPNLPTFIHLINCLAKALMEQLELDCWPISLLVQEGSPKRIFVAFPEKNRILMLRLFYQVIPFVLSLYPAKNLPSNIKTECYLSNLKHLLKNIENTGKNRGAKDLQRHLITSDKPWFSLDFNQPTKNYLQVGFGRSQQVFNNMVTFDSAAIGVDIANSKMQSIAFLSDLGFAVPKQMPVSTAEQASQSAREIGFPVVLKVDIGSQGRHVYSDLRSDEEVKQIFEQIKEELKQTGQKTKILIERFISGNIYRVEVVKGQFFDAYQMIPAGIIGDGRRSIKALVDIENAKPNRKKSSDVWTTYVALKLGEPELLMLKKQGLDIDSVPLKDQQVRLRVNSNWSSGGTFEKVTELVHKDNQRLVEKIATSLNVDLLGIDLIGHDISQSFIQQALHTIEVNHNPHIGSYVDAKGNFIDIAERVLQRVVPDCAYGDVPVFMFKGSQSAKEAEYLLAGSLNQLGYSAGLINSDGLMINGLVWSKPDKINFQNPSLQLLRDNTVGAAIIEQSSENLTNFGLGSGGCDIAVILDSKSKKVVTSLWPEGLASTKIDRFLSLSARLACIVLIEDRQELDSYLMHCPKTLFALFLNDNIATKSLEDSGVNHIKILEQTAKSVLLCINYKNEQHIKIIETASTHNIVPYLVVLASLLVLEVEIKVALALLERHIFKVLDVAL